MRHSLKILYCCFLTLLTTALCAQEKADSNKVPPPKSFITNHQGVFGGKIIRYKATAKESYLKNDKGDSVASIWSVAYTQEGLTDLSKRPVTFVFNGGPGSASIWLHMGMFGPQIVKVDSDAKKDDGAAPYALVDNKQGLLDLTDLVFIDPVGTGYSRVVGKGKNEDYWGLKEDAASIAKFMRLWVTENKRWFSPKYIAGESFGTTRAAAVANALEKDGQTMDLNGLVLISQALDYTGSTSIHDNITSNLTYLPSMAATAWYHKKAGQGKTLEAFVEECRKFTYDNYAPALYRGSLLSAAEQNAVAEKMAYFIGLDKNYILRSNLSILMHRFQKQLLADQGLAIGRLDGRFMGDEADKVSEGPDLGDPSDYQIGGAYTAALNHYYASTLKVEMDRPYLTSNDEVGEKWRWRPVPDGQYWEPMPVNVARQLGETMRRNTAMKVLVASGYYDLICPFFDTEYTFARNGIVPERVTKTYYEAGHMMYLHEPDMVKLAGDIRKFLTE
ncbi:S10 family peptidase [Haliscomenobacter sp.]|uniref:S10 family peptidase n=1 Tax=Haliscomenobacter sp. TaxID=2717303 RepID=UPI003BACFC30